MNTTLIKRKISFFSSIIDYLLKVIIFVFLSIAFVTLIASRFSLFGLHAYTVLTGSMEPTLPVGSIIYTFPSKTYSVNDVISFKTSNNIFITHRIVEKITHPDGVVYRVKGDANNVVDTDMVSESAISGKAITLIPFLGYVVFFIKTIPGFIAFVVFPTLFFVALEFVNIKREIEKEVRKKIHQQLYFR